MRRRTNAAGGMNLDSLLDTLTNVVGILVIVLVLTTLDVSSAVQRIMEIDPSAFGISAQKLADAEKQAQQQHDQLLQLDQQAKQLDQQVIQDNTQLNDVVLRLNDLRLGVTPAPEPVQVDPAKLKKLVEEHKKKADELSQQLVKAEDELAKLKSLLDDTPVREAPPAEIVNMPNPREAPTGSKAVLFMCRGGKVMYFDPDGLRDRVKKRVEFVMKPMQARAGAKGEIDCEELVQQANRSPISDDYFRANVIVQNYNLYVVYEQRDEGGETAQRIGDATSRYRSLLKRIDPQKYYLRFLVWSDSFDAYVVARRVCDEYDLPAGWEPYDATYEWKTGLGVKVACQGRPPPSPNPPSSTPAGPPQPLPNDQVD